jgi:hypothetical protein
VARDHPVRQNEHEGRRDVLSGVLSRLTPEIPIERLYTAGERLAVMLRPEGLNPRALNWPRPRSYAPVALR